jgi:hypothetical protein
VKAKSKPHRMHDPPDDDFRRSILAANRRHYP